MFLSSDTMCQCLTAAQAALTMNYIMWAGRHHLQGGYAESRQGRGQKVEIWSWTLKIRRLVVGLPLHRLVAELCRHAECRRLKTADGAVAY